MKAVVLTTVAIASCLYMAAEAQTPSSTASQSARSTDAVVLQGCVERDSSPAASTASAFKLTKVEKGDDKSAPSSTAGAAGSAATAGAASASAAMKLEKEYKLEASSSSVDLSQHVSHKVEITGTMAGAAATRSGSMSGAGASSSTASGGATSTGSTPSTPSTTPGASGGSSASSSASTASAARAGSADTPTLRVTSLRMISASCQ